jgi:hypothetical protein
MKTYDGKDLTTDIDVEMIMSHGTRYGAVKDRVMQEFAVDFTELLLAKTNGSVGKAAKLAGMDRSGFRRLMRRAGFRVSKASSDG